jgi:hypothetical protein
MTNRTKRNRTIPLRQEEIETFSFNVSLKNIGCSFRVKKIYEDNVVFTAYLLPGCEFTITNDKKWTPDRIRGMGLKALTAYALDSRRIRQQVVSCGSFLCSKSSFVGSYTHTWSTDLSSIDIAFRLVCR